MIHGCAWIDGNPADFHTVGDAIFCGRRTRAPGEAWCTEHRKRVYEQPASDGPPAVEETRQAA
jgi:hypothetical protein